MKNILSFPGGGDPPAVYRRQPPLLRGAETGKTDMPLTPGAQRNTAFSPLNKGGCPKDKGDLPASMSLGRLFLHTLREKAFAATMNRYSIQKTPTGNQIMVLSFIPRS